jgi:hypothetical protein
VGHQVNFFVMDADLSDLETAMRTVGDVCFLADKSPTCEPVELDTIAFGPATESPRLRTCFVVRRKDVAAVSTRFIKTQGYWLIEGTESPVIEFMPGVFSGTKLTRGRACFASDLRFRPELPSPEFVRWGDRVLGRIKKTLTRHPEFAPPWMYFGAAVLEWIENSGATMTGGAISLAVPDRG